MKTALGYTLVELMIVISIMAILFSFGMSAYGKARDRQTVEQAKELILSVLQDSQKAAYVGDKTCVGSLQGITVGFTATTITTSTSCSTGSPIVHAPVTIPNVTITSFPTIIFRPLEQGVTLNGGSADSVDINYQISGNNYRVKVSKPGIIEYIGAY